MGGLANEEKIISALGIRDTNNHTSTIDESKGFIPKTLVVQNNLNQQISIQLQGDIDATFSNPMNIGGAFYVAANDSDYATLTDYLPFLRVVASCQVSPTTGALTVYIAKVSG